MLSVRFLMITRDRDLAAVNRDGRREGSRSHRGGHQAAVFRPDVHTAWGRRARGNSARLAGLSVSRPRRIAAFSAARKVGAIRFRVRRDPGGEGLVLTDDRGEHGLRVRGHRPRICKKCSFCSFQHPRQDSYERHTARSVAADRQ